MRVMSPRCGLVVKRCGLGVPVLGVPGRCHQMRCMTCAGGRARMWPWSALLGTGARVVRGCVPGAGRVWTPPGFKPGGVLGAVSVWGAAEVTSR
jgi:hypothetical protein